MNEMAALWRRTETVDAWELGHLPPSKTMVRGLWPPERVALKAAGRVMAAPAIGVPSPGAWLRDIFQKGAEPLRLTRMPLPPAAVVVVQAPVP